MEIVNEKSTCVWEFLIQSPLLNALKILNNCTNLELIAKAETVFGGISVEFIQWDADVRDGRHH